MMKNAFRIIGLGTSDAAELFRTIRGTGNITLLVGSAISMGGPTFLPSGNTVTKHLAGLLVDQFEFTDGSERNEVFNAIVTVPFEYAWDQAPNNPLLTKVVVDSYKDKPPNAIHQAIKSLFEKGIIRHIITTNYDTCLDQVFYRTGNLITVVTKEDSARISEGQSIYFKIHGSAANGLEPTVIYRLSHEGVLPEWKRSVLSRCLQDSVLLVIGYSGLDFEICPEIKMANPVQVIWNCHENPEDPDPIVREKTLRPNALRVLNGSDQNVAVWGDMTGVFSVLGEQIPELTIRQTPPNWELEKILDKTELQIWACSVISPPGFGFQAEKLAKRILDSLEEKSTYYPYTLYLLGDALFHKGKYAKSAEYCSQAAQVFSSDDDLPNYIKSVSRQADALRCGGLFWEALLALVIAQKHLRDSSLQPNKKKRIGNELILKELLVYRDFYEISSWLGNIRLAKYYQSYAKSLITKIVKTAVKEGQWNMLQQSKMWASRMDIEFSRIYQGTMQPLDDWLGFKHLGAIIAEMMTARDALWRDNTGVEITPEEILRLIQRAEGIKSFPEIWKLSLAFNENYAVTKGIQELDWKKAFYECEYTDFLRSFKLASPRHR